MNFNKYDLYVNGDKKHSITDDEYKVLHREARKDYRVLAGAFLLTLEPAYFVIGHAIRFIGTFGGLAFIFALITAKSYLPVLLSGSPMENGTSVTNFGAMLFSIALICGVFSGVLQLSRRDQDGPFHLAVTRTLCERFDVNPYADVRLRRAISAEEV